LVTPGFTFEDYEEELVENMHQRVKVCMVTANGKNRVITKMNAESLAMCGPIQRDAFKYLHSHPTFFFTSHAISLSTDAFLKIKGDGVYVSGDYQAATDRFHHLWTQYTINRIGVRLGYKPAYLSVITDTLSPPLAELNETVLNGDFQMKNGQMMGHPLSFPALCIINAAIYKLAEGNKKALKNMPVLINGDDIVFRTTSLATAHNWMKIVKDSGLVLSPGKNYISPRYAQLNSRVVDMSTISLINGVFLPLLCNFRESHISPTLVDLVPRIVYHDVKHRSYNTLGGELSDVLMGCKTDKQYEQRLNIFVRSRSEKNSKLETYKDLPLCPFFSRRAGGLGAPPPPSWNDIKTWNVPFLPERKMNKTPTLRGFVRQTDAELPPLFPHGTPRPALSATEQEDVKSTCKIHIPKGQMALTTLIDPDNTWNQGISFISKKVLTGVKKSSPIRRYLNSKYSPQIVEHLHSYFKLQQDNTKYLSFKHLKDIISGHLTVASNPVIGFKTIRLHPQLVRERASIAEVVSIELLPNATQDNKFF